MSGRTSDAFWSRKSAEWEAELQTVDAERARLEATHAPVVATAEKILELAKKAEILYKSQKPSEQRRLLETVLSNRTFDRGSLKPTYTSPFDLLVKGNETGNWRRGWGSDSPFAASTSALARSGGQVAATAISSCQRRHPTQFSIELPPTNSQTASERGWRRGWDSNLQDSLDSVS